MVKSGKKIIEQIQNTILEFIKDQPDVYDIKDNYESILFKTKHETKHEFELEGSTLYCYVIGKPWSATYNKPILSIEDFKAAMNKFKNTDDESWE